MQLTAIDIVKILQNSGFEAYWAGGCVRDMLLGKKPKDFDIVTSAKPEQIEEIFEHSIPIGKKFGIIKIIKNGHHFEIATFRSDAGYSDGRRPDAVIFSNAEEDAKRRDFTINGMFYDPVADKIIDLVGGQKDLEEHLIRFIGEPKKRIAEDHLRILRAVRLKHQLKFQYEPETYKALAENSELVIDKVSKERIRDEFNLMIQCEKPSQAFEDLSHLGILKVVLPELEAMRGVAQPYEYHHEGDVWTHAMAALDSLTEENFEDLKMLEKLFANNPPFSVSALTLRWATLLHDIGKPETFKLAERIRFDSHCEASEKIAQKILTRLCFGRKFINDVCWIVLHHMMMVPLTEMPEGRKIHWFFEPQFKNLLGVFKADAMGTTPTDLSLYQQIFDLYHQALKKFPEVPEPLLDGNEIMEICGLKPGPKIKELVGKLKEMQFEGKIHSKAEALEYMKSFIELPPQN